MIEPSCSQCQSRGLAPGFVSDYGQGSKGFIRWVEGRLARGPLGGAKLMGRRKWEVDAYRCPNCGHLELFAVRPE